MQNNFIIARRHSNLYFIKWQHFSKYVFIGNISQNNPSRLVSFSTFASEILTSQSHDSIYKNN